MHPTPTHTVSIPTQAATAIMQLTTYCGKYLTKKTKGYNTHTAAKMYGLYFLLKAESSTGCIHNYARQLPFICEQYGISLRSFHTYIKQLEALQLVTREANKCLRIAGYTQLEKILDINAKERIQINFEYGKQKIQWWLAAVEIKCNQQKQAVMVQKKVNKNPEIKHEVLTTLINNGFNIKRLNEPEYFADSLMFLAIKSFRSGTDIHEILISIRSDVNRSCKAISNAWAMSPQLVSYYKKQMALQRIVSISKLSVQSEWSRETKECHKNRYCHVIYDAKNKERVWFFPDQINVLLRRKTKENFTISAAA